MVSLGILHHRRRPYRVYSRWLSRSAVPVISLFSLDIATVTVWDAVFLSAFPSPLPQSEAGRAWWSFLDSEQWIALLTIFLGWLLTLHIVPIFSRQHIITPRYSPQTYLILMLAAGGSIQLLAAVLPWQAELPHWWYTVVIPGVLIGVIHCTYDFLRQRCHPRRSKSLLMAPQSVFLPLKQHLSQYERLLRVQIVGSVAWDDHIPIPELRLTDYFDDIILAMRKADASTLLLPESVVSRIVDFEDLRWMLENEGLYLDVVIERVALAQEQTDLDVAPGIAVLRAASCQDSWLHAFTKRSFDLIISLTLILLLTPLWVYLIVKIRREDGGPAFFYQVRVGRGGQLFPMFKFRTMVVDAEARLAELREKEKQKREAAFVDGESPDTGVLFKLVDDPRVTSIGSFLRKSSIDELPQLFNVLFGHMSLVGPRPPLPHEVEQYAPRVMRKFNVRPGITGLWQVSGRSDLSWTESVRLDLFYVENRSLAMDLKILVKTFRVVFRQSGAY